MFKVDKEFKDEIAVFNKNNKSRELHPVVQPKGGSRRIKEEDETKGSEDVTISE